MRKWLVRRLFRLCFAIDFREAIAQAQISALSWIMTQDIFEDNEPEPAPKKRGRPAKAANWRTHTWVPGEKPAPKKRGRPLGSKNKPKETLQ